jgi:hypothetical protein
MKNQTKFSEQLIKGKITELIFEQMLREAGWLHCTRLWI